MRLYIFDLDGTLIDSERDLVESVNATLAFLGRPPLPPRQIASYVGNGAPVLMRRSLGAEAPEEEVERALEFFIAYYSEHRLDHTRLYPGVRETLDTLREQGALQAVLTNKPVRISMAILNDLALGEHFIRVYGGNSFAEKKPHPVGIETLMNEANVRVDQTLMVGDSPVDIETGRNAGVRTCGVTYGFQPEALRAAGPDFVIDRLQDLLALHF